MSNKNQIVGYDVTVRGSYYSADGNKRVLKVYGPATFFIPEFVEIPNGKKKVVKKDGDKVISTTYVPQTAKRAVTIPNVARYVIMRRILPTWLAENHPDGVTFRTCDIVPGSMKRVMRDKSQALILDKPIKEMSLQELAAFCKLKSINTPISAFDDAAEARKAVQYEIDLQNGRGGAGVTEAPDEDAELSPSAPPEDEEVPTGDKERGASLFA